ncbi:MAG: hypothetical protein ACYCYO_20845 [Bacilli bacterium]
MTQETTWNGRTIAYTYDNVGNRASMSVTQNGTTTTTAYGYNTEKNRLTSITVGSNPAQTVTFDGAGNTLSDGTNRNRPPGASTRVTSLKTRKRSSTGTCIIVSASNYIKAVIGLS